MQLESIIKSFTPAGVIGEWLEKGYIRLSEKNNAYYYTEAGQEEITPADSASLQTVDIEAGLEAEYRKDRLTDFDKLKDLITVVWLAGYNDAVQETLKTTLETASGRGLGKPKPKVKLGVKPAIVTRETMKEFGFR
jgi:hypothetical protein